MGYKLYYKYAQIGLLTALIVYVTINGYGLISRSTHVKSKYEGDKNKTTLTHHEITPGSSKAKLHPPRNILTQELEQQRRINMIHNVCRNVSLGRTENILIYPVKKISYCVIPKNGCTFWIRIMRYLNNDTSTKVVTNPFDITRSEAHFLPFKQTLYRLDNKEHKKIVFNTTRFMVSRNPYTKLLSGYIDKLFLPLYWIYKGKAMIKTIRENASSLSLRCGHDLTFLEYIKYILSQKEDQKKIDGHFRPTQFYCSPCLYKPHFLIKQESFKKDSEFVLEQFGLQDLVKSYDHKSHVMDELIILLDDYYNWLKSALVKECLGHQKYLLRIWKTFQINGYLPLGSETVLDPNKTYSKKDFTRILLANIHSGDKSKEVMKRQKHDIMVNMYRSIPRDILQQIVQMFKFDFEVFGYEMYPKDIFS